MCTPPSVLPPGTLAACGCPEQGGEEAAHVPGPSAVTLEPPLHSLVGQRCPRPLSFLPHTNPPPGPHPAWIQAIHSALHLDCAHPPPTAWTQAIHSTLRLDCAHPPPTAWTQAIHSALRLNHGRAAGVTAFRELPQVSRACPAAFRPALEKSQAGDASPRPALQGPV